MQLRLGKYQGLAHGFTCACHTPNFAQISSRISAGMSRRSVLKGIVTTFAASSLSTRNAELFGMSGKRNPYPSPLGVIKSGALADILIIDGNPLENLSLLADPDRYIKLIMKDGRVYKDTISGK